MRQAGLGSTRCCPSYARRTRAARAGSLARLCSPSCLVFLPILVIGSKARGVNKLNCTMHGCKSRVCGAFQLSRAAQYITNFRDSQENTPVSSLAPRQLPPSAPPLWQPGPALRLSESPKSGNEGYLGAPARMHPIPQPWLPILRPRGPSTGDGPPATTLLYSARNREELIFTGLIQEIVAAHPHVRARFSLGSIPGFGFIQIFATNSTNSKQTITARVGTTGWGCFVSRCRTPRSFLRHPF